MYKELAVEPVNAYYTDTFDVVDEVVGCSFNTDTAHNTSLCSLDLKKGTMVNIHQIAHINHKKNPASG